MSHETVFTELLDSAKGKDTFDSLFGLMVFLNADLFIVNNDSFFLDNNYFSNIGLYKIKDDSLYKVKDYERLFPVSTILPNYWKNVVVKLIEHYN